MHDFLRILGGAAMWALIGANVHAIATLLTSSWRGDSFAIHRRHRVSRFALSSIAPLAIVVFLTTPYTTGNDRASLLTLFAMLALFFPLPSIAFARVAHFRRRLKTPAA